MVGKRGERTPSVTADEFLAALAASNLRLQAANHSEALAKVRPLHTHIGSSICVRFPAQLTAIAHSPILADGNHPEALAKIYVPHFHTWGLAEDSCANATRASSSNTIPATCRVMWLANCPCTHSSSILLLASIPHRFSLRRHRPNQPPPPPPSSPRRRCAYAMGCG